MNNWSLKGIKEYTYFNAFFIFIVCFEALDRFFPF